jgi:hypothetical protein
LYRSVELLLCFGGTVYPESIRGTIVRHPAIQHYRPISLNVVVYYLLTGGEVLKLLRIKSLRKKSIKAVNSFIVIKLPHKYSRIYNTLNKNPWRMVKYVLRLVVKATGMEKKKPQRFFFAA